VRDEVGQGYGDRLLSLVMLQVLDEKWKDHLYDLDQLRSSIHYRSWGQKDPLIEYKHEAYTMFVDLMNDIANTFTERFLRVQIVFEPPAPPSGRGNGGPARQDGARGARKRYNALGILEEVSDEAPAGATAGGTAPGDGEEPTAMDVGPAPSPSAEPVAARRDPLVVGAGRPRPLSAAQAGSAAPANVDWSTVGRNDPCPCGSGKKFKKCHGVNA
jgi:preprotein translocase subunit SecA